LIVGNLFGSSLGVVINATSVFHRVAFTRLPRVDSWVQIWQCAKKSKDYPRYYLWADLLCSAAQWLPVIFISARFSAAAAGAFFLGRRIIRIPLALLTSNVGKVVYQRSSQFFFEKPAEMTSFITRTCGILFLLGLLPAVVLFVTAEPMFALIFGESWRQAGQFVMILSPLFLAQFSVGPFGYVFNTVGQQRTYLFWEAIRFSSVLFVFSVIAPRTDLLTTIIWYSATLTGVYGLNLVLLLKSLAASTVDRQAS
jgi:O-antigen/teichoic acid export membrane protein